MEKERDFRIDLIKLIAAIMVVILHTITIEKAGTLQSVVCLTGTFGIPLFFMCNGYLLYSREFSFDYIKRKIFSILKFVLLWTLVIGVIESIIERKFTIHTLLAGILVGGSKLYHLWFCFALIFIYITFGIIGFISRNKKWHRNINIISVAVIMTIINIEFIINTILGGDVIFGKITSPFRLITNSAYFMLGILLCKLCKLYNDKKPFLKNTRNIYIYIYIYRIIAFIAAAVSYVGICLISAKFNYIFPSSMYSTVFCLVGSLSIFVLCLSLNSDNKVFSKIMSYVSPCCIGIWVTHPFVISVFRNIMKLIGVEMTLTVRIIMFAVVLVGSFIGTKLALKIKGVRVWFKM